MICVILALVFCVFRVSSNDALETSPESSSDGFLLEVPSLALIYDLEKFPGQVEAYCETGDKTLELDLRSIPDLDQPVLNDPRTTKKRITWEKEDIAATRKARGLICSVKSERSDKFDMNKHYNVAVPLMDKASKYVPLRLTATINANDSLHVSFQQETSINEVMWQMEPVSTSIDWKTVNITKNKEIVIEHGKILKEGFYSFIRSTGNSQERKNKERYGTLAVIKRRCSKDKYGDDCNKECPECMYGGICHDKTGKCVCPPGRIGNYCEKSCNGTEVNKILIGPKCKIEIVDPRQKLLCLPNPYGCSCAPGKMGQNCKEECSREKWGVGCKYSCNHCKSNHCNDVTGKCNPGEEEAPCAGGPLGLPRLRNKPTVSDEEVDDPLKRMVTFEPWEKDITGNGELPKDAKIVGYKVHLMGKTNLTRDVNGYTVTLSKLNEGEHEVAVYVNVQLEDGTNCTNNGKYRNTTIQKTPFNVTCPERNLPPSVVTYESSETELSLAWEDSPCDPEEEKVYKLNLINSHLGTTYNGVTPYKNFKFEKLQPNQMYNVTFQSCLKKETNCSKHITIGFYSDSEAPPELLESSGPTAKIRLPTVLHPPACQYVVVVESKGDLDDEAVKKKSLDVVTTYSEEYPNTCADAKSLTEGPDGVVTYIAGVVSVQNDTANDFEIGKGEANNKPLEEGRDYKVTVVTETNTGDIKTYAVSKPVNPRKAIASGISGFLFGALFFVLLIFLFVWTNRVRKSRSQEVTQNEQNAQQDHVSMDILGLDTTSSGTQQAKDGQK